VDKLDIMRADRMTAISVGNQAGEDLGEIEDLLIDVKEGRVAAAAVDFGDWWGATTLWPPSPGRLSRCDLLSGKPSST